MDDAKLMQKAKAVYETFCDALTADDWKYTRHDEDLVITCGAKGEDLPMDILVRVDAQRQLISVLSRMPLAFDENKRIEGNLAVCVANKGMVHGCFDFDNNNGKIYFRMANSYRGTVISKDLCLYMMYCACSTIDNYNDKFLMLTKGMITLDQFIKSEEN